MLNLSFDLPRDVKETAKIQRARQSEEERKKRIFNARNRLIGVSIILKNTITSEFFGNQPEQF